ncbi:4Fe-4S dicluster domain-containing protein [Chloroflexota bacterium]
MAVEEKKKKKVIKVDVDKCNGCRACEAICSAFHAEPKYGSINPEKSKIRVLFDPIKDVYVPVYAGEYTEAECSGRGEYTIDEKTYDECSFCRASCPARDIFKDPDSGLPLKCDMCLDDPPQDEPLCVKWCLSDALTYEEVDDDEDREEPADEMETGLNALIKKHGFKKVMEILANMKEENSDKEKGLEE